MKLSTNELPLTQRFTEGRTRRSHDLMEQDLPRTADGVSPSERIKISLPMNSSVRRALFVFFFLSGFSSLVYQVVWTRLAFASFGIIAPVLSVVLSVFMLGLTVGSWGGGRLIRTLVKKTGLSAILFYGLAEGMIGLGAFIVPTLFAISERLLAQTGEMNSFSYLLASALALAISIFPWCVCMGATFPFMMGYFQKRDAQSSSSFSFLYVANVLGAMSGTIITAVVLIETLGFHHTLWIAAGGNFLIALGSIVLSRFQPGNLAIAEEQAPVESKAAATSNPDRARLYKFVLFSTGFLSMAMEVVWSRGFVGVLKTQVYSFALIIFAYLAATFFGSLFYRRDVRLGHVRPRDRIFFWMAFSALLPILINDPTVTTQRFNDPAINLPSALLLLGSLFPLCALLGYLTPSLIDEYSAGQPQRAGTAYAINVVGCILGPLVACYFLLPFISARYALILLGLPFIFFWVASSGPGTLARHRAGAILLAALLAYTVFLSRDFEEGYARATKKIEVRRDYIASVVAFDQQPWGKILVVNGTGMTSLTPITKCIASLPLALHQGESKSVLVICFGMGTTFRSALTWGVDTTVVELVPSVPEEFGFYHPDAAKSLNNPNGHIIIDDGRRYLNRCGKKFDVITVDPPPPVETAGSSLLYSAQFYELAKEHLKPNGIVQMWHMGSDKRTDQAIFRSIYSSFPHVRFFGSVEGWGFHMLGSMEPIVVPPVDQIVAKFPPAAAADLVEWNPTKTPAEFFNLMLNREYDVKKELSPDLNLQITDDRPLNEYYLMRQMEYGNK